MRTPPPDAVCFEVELYGLTCFVFAVNAKKARYIAVRSYWDAYGRRRGEWPRATAKRAPLYDKNPERNYREQAWATEAIRGY